MPDEKRTTTIELTPQDETRIKSIKEAIGATSTIAVIRFGLYAALDRLARDREMVERGLAVQGLPLNAQIKSILTDLLDDEGSKESLDGAVARIMALKS